MQAWYRATEAANWYFPVQEYCYIIILLLPNRASECSLTQTSQSFTYWECGIDCPIFVANQPQR